MLVAARVGEKFLQRHQRDRVDEVALRTAVADAVEEVVRAVRDDAAAALQRGGLEHEVRGDLVGGDRRVRRSDLQDLAREWERFVADIVERGVGVVDVDFLALGLVEARVGELACGAVDARRRIRRRRSSSGNIFFLGVEVGAELQVLDLRVGRIVERWHRDDVLTRDGVEGDVVEAVDLDCAGTSGIWVRRRVVQAAAAVAVFSVHHHTLWLIVNVVVGLVLILLLLLLTTRITIHWLFVVECIVVVVEMLSVRRS